MIPELEELYPEGSDITIYNTFYQYPMFQDGKKITDDFLALIYKDNETGKKDYIIIEKPTYRYYILKDGEEVPDYNKLFIERDKVIPVDVPFNELEKDIAKRTDNMEFYKQNIRERNKAANKQLHMMPQVFSSDTSIENHYRFRFAQTYQNNVTKLKKGFFDIEVDGKFAAGDFVELGECEINCVTYLDMNECKAYTFILRNDDNPLIASFEDDIASGRFGYKEIHAFITEACGGPEKLHKFGLDNLTYEIKFYSKEIELIADLFQTMHTCSPDFIEGWNSSGFDIAYIIARIIRLGFDPADIMCDKRWKYKVVKNYVDHKNMNDTPERGDFTFISGLPIFIDQMIQYASRRKAKFGSMQSTKLDDIGEIEAGIHKLDYSYITRSVVELPWLNFMIFVLYNIMDTIVQEAIESQTEDLEYIFTKCIVNNTVYQKGHRQSIYLINRIAAEMYKSGYIMGNNPNRANEKPPKYLGAIVGEPTLTSDYSKRKIDGRPIWVCDSLIDFDYSSMYPNSMIEFNIAPNTQVGRIVIPEQVYDDENPYMVEETKYSRGGEFLDNMVVDNHLEFMHRWFGLPSIEEVVDEIDNFYNQFGFGTYSTTLYDPKAAILPVGTYVENDTEKNTDVIEPAIIFYERPKLEDCHDSRGFS